MNIYVGNLSFDATEVDVEHAFSQYGDVKTVSIVKDRDTGRSRGFGFVEMDDHQAGQQAIEGVNLQQIAGSNFSASHDDARTSASRQLWLFLVLSSPATGMDIHSTSTWRNPEKCRACQLTRGAFIPSRNTGDAEGTASRQLWALFLVLYSAATGMALHSASTWRNPKKRRAQSRPSQANR